MAAQRYPGMAQAMLKQLNRVNGTGDDRVRELLRQIADLQEENTHLRRQLNGTGEGATRESPLNDDPSEPRATLTHNGRPAATAMAVADHYGVALSTITRKVASGKLAGVKHGATRWIVYLDQPIGPFKAHRSRGN